MGSVLESLSFPDWAAYPLGIISAAFLASIGRAAFYRLARRG